MIFPLKHQAAEINIFSKMSALAHKHNAINLSQGFPDFPINEKLAENLLEASQLGFNQYAPMQGLQILREAIATDFRERYHIELNPETEITITPGATYGIYTALNSILSKGDEVIVLEPAYDSYHPNIEMMGGIPISVKLDSVTFAPNWTLIEDAISSRTKAIIINTPHNPTGSIWDKNDWDQLADLVRGKNIVIISDEVYEQLVYDDQKHFSVLQHPELREQSFAIFSFGKALHNTGWKIGYCVGSEEATKVFRRLHQFVAFSVNTPAQYAIAKFITTSPTESARSVLQEKRNFFNTLMKGTAFELLKVSSGSYFQLVSYAHLSKMPDKQFATMLTEQFGVATIPISAFYKDGLDDKILRFCFAKKKDTIQEAVERLKKF